jgi:hypothetical protein
MRSAVRTAAGLAAAFDGFTVLTQWGQQIDPEALPGLAVFTPRETSTRAAAGSYQRATDVVVLIRRAGAAALEDDLDGDAAAAEAMVLAALEALAPDDVEFLSAETDIPAAGETRIGNLTLTFRVLQLT